MVEFVPEEKKKLTVLMGNKDDLTHRKGTRIMFIPADIK
jgi:hypothetical protein